MKITVKIFATLTQYLSEEFLAQYPQGSRSGSPIELELSEGSTLNDLVNSLDLPKELVKVTFVNGRAEEPDHRLQAGDEVGMFPPIAGG